MSSRKETETPKITSFFSIKKGRPKKRKKKNQGGRPKKDKLDTVKVPPSSGPNIVIVSLKSNTILSATTSPPTSPQTSESSSSKETDEPQPQLQEHSSAKMAGRVPRVQWAAPKNFPILQKAIVEKRRLGRLYNPMTNTGTLYVPESTLMSVLKRLGNKEPTFQNCFPTKKTLCYQAMQLNTCRTSSVREIK